MEFGWLKWPRKKEVEAVEKGKSLAETSEGSKSSPETENPEEEILSSREKISSREIGKGICDAEFVELKDDGKAVFKMPGYKQERAAYLIDRFLGLGLVPSTVIRKFGGKIGSIQQFIPDAKMAADITKLSLAIRYSNELMKLWIFDWIILNTDRHGGNFLVKGGRIYAIDNGCTLDPADNSYSPRPYPYADFFDQELPADFVEKFKRFLAWPEGQNVLRGLLEELIGKKTAQWALKRIKIVGSAIAKKGRFETSDVNKLRQLLQS